MKSVMGHKFSEVPQASIPRSTFDRSHGVKTTFDSGKLVPFFADEALPGDTFNLRTAGLARLSTPLFPIMDNMFLDTFYFAVPLRLIHDNFKKMMGEQENPTDSVDFLTPQCESGFNIFANESLQDYLGLPTNIFEVSHSAYFTRAYNLIWNEWFRDQNLQDSVVVDKDDGPDDYADYNLLPRGKRHDYFTSCLPWPQKFTEINLPIGGSAPVTGVGWSNTAGVVNQNLYETDALAFRLANVQPSNTQNLNIEEDSTNLGFPNIRADLDATTAMGGTINALRQSFQIQKMFETDARSGTRYTEVVKAHFGVTSPDSRLQRPEYLGGGSSPVNITPVAATAGFGAEGVGDLAGYGTATFTGHGFSKSFTEHCVIIGLVNVRADLTYQQGMNRMFSRQGRLDYYWPSLAVIGEQAVLNKEIYMAGSSLAADDEIFGYQERYAEYRYKPSTIHGKFRSNDPQSLDAWHLCQDFASRPVLGDTFIEDNPPINRVVRVPSEPHFIADFYHKLTCARPMPLYGIPWGMDRF